MSSIVLCFLVACLLTLAAGRPDIADRSEARESDTKLGRSGVTEEENPVLEYLRSSSARTNHLPPGGKREITYFQAFPKTLDPPKRPNIITAPSTSPVRDPNKSPYENFNEFVLVGRRPEENLVNSPVLLISDSNKVATPNRTLTKVDIVPAVATIYRTYDEHGLLKSSLTKYEPAGLSENSATADTRQQITWPYAAYFPILIKDPFLSAFNALATGSSFSFSSLVEYGPEADICKARESKKEHDDHIRNARSIKKDSEKLIEANIRRVLAAEEAGRRQVMAKRVVEEIPRRIRQTRITVSDPEKGVASIRIEGPEEGSDEPQLSVRKGGVSVAGPGGFATAYSGGTAVVGPYGTIFKSPDGVAVAGPHSRIINITDDISFSEILRMYETSKVNKTLKLPQRSFREGASSKTVKKLFSYKTLRPVTLTNGENTIKARKLSTTISDAVTKTRQKLKDEFQNIKKQDFGAKEGETTLVLAPKAEAKADGGGVAVSSPISHAVVQPGELVHIVFQPLASASAGPGGLAHAHSDLDSFFQADEIEARARNPNLILPALSTVILPPVSGYDERKKKPNKPDKEENSEEENVGEEQEEASSQEPSDGVAINPPPEGSSVAEAKPVGLAIAGPGGVASSKPVAQAIVGPGGLAIARPVATAVAGVEVDGSIPIGAQQQQQLKKPQKKKPKQEYDNESEELQYVGGLSGPIGSPKPKHTPPETNYIGGLKGMVGNPIPKHETPGPSARQGFQFRLGESGGKYGFMPFFQQTQSRALEKKMDTPTFFHGMIGSQGHNMPANVYPLVYY